MSYDRGRRVLFVQSTAERYGSDRSLLLLATGLVERGWQVTVALPTEGPLAGDLAAAGCQVVTMPVGAFRRVFTLRQWARYLLIELPSSAFGIRRLAMQADVVHLNTSVLLGAALGAVLARRPLVWHVRESYADHRRQWHVYGRIVNALATAVVANSSAVAAEAPSARMRDRIVVIPNGLRFPPLPAPHEAEDGVLCVGRISSWKGHEVLLDSIARLRSSGLELRTSIAGDIFPGGDRYRDLLCKRIADGNLGDTVSLLGFVDDVENLLSGHAIFVQPSRRPETFGLALVEAMAAGLACIATDVGGPAEIVRHGDTGLLVPPGDSVALAEALERLARDPELRRTLGTGAARDVRLRFDIDNTVEQVESLYAGLFAP